MAYEKIHWVNESTKLSAKNLNHMDDGIELANDKVEELEDSKQDKLVSSENIKTINGQSVLGPGNIEIGGSVAWGNITGNIENQTDLVNKLNTKVDKETGKSLIENTKIELIDTLDDEVNEIMEDYLTSEDKTELQDLVNAEKGRAEVIEAGLRTDLNTVRNDYLKSIDKTELDNKITAESERAKAAEANKINKLGKVIGTEEDYHLPYFAEIKPGIEDIKLDVYTVNINDGSQKTYTDNYILPAATNDKAGIMSVADKVKVNDSLPTYNIKVNPGTATEYSGPANVPVFFEVEPKEDKAIIKAHSIQLNSTKNQNAVVNSLELGAATNTNAGLMSKADKLKLDTEIPVQISNLENNKINKLGKEQYSGEDYHLPYHAVIRPDTNNIKLDVYTIAPDTKELKIYNQGEYKIEAASSTKAGLLTTDGYTKLYTDLPELQTKVTDLQDRVNNLQARGRFLSNWDCETGKPTTDPTTALPYVYKAGDYFLVSKVGTGTNYRPDGTQYEGQASTVAETNSVNVGDYYTYDGNAWLLINNTQKVVNFANIGGQPTDNANLNTALNAKQNVISDLETIRNGASLGATAVQPSAINDMATKTWVEGKGYLTEHQSLAGYATETWVENKGYLTEHQSLANYRKSADQDTIDNAIKDRVSTIEGKEAGWDAKQAALTTAQLAAVNSGITSDKVSAYDGYSTGKQDKLTAGENITITDNVISAAGHTIPTIVFKTSQIIVAPAPHLLATCFTLSTTAEQQAILENANYDTIKVDLTAFGSAAPVPYIWLKKNVAQVIDGKTLIQYSFDNAGFWYDDVPLFNVVTMNKIGNGAAIYESTTTKNLYVTYENFKPETKQDVLTAGENITIEDNVISAATSSITGIKVGEGTNSLVFNNTTNNTATGSYANAAGNSTIKIPTDVKSKTTAEIITDWSARGDNKYSLAKGESSHVEGTNCLALEKNAHAEGNGTVASNNSAHSEGTGSQATGKYSHAEGLETLASGLQSHAEGRDTKAYGDSSHAEGRDTKTYKQGQHAEGVGTECNNNATDESQHVAGYYNEIKSGARLTGNGSTSQRKNIEELDWAGNLMITGNLKAAGLTDGTTTKTMSEILAGDIKVSYDEAYDIKLGTSCQNMLPSEYNEDFAVIGKETTLKFMANRDTMFDTENPGRSVIVSGAAASIEITESGDVAYVTLTNPTGDITVTVKAFGE